MALRLSLSGRIFFSLLVCLLLAACQFPMGKRQGEQDFAPVKNPCVVLALPASGPYAGVSAKIRKGAEIGRQTLRQQGIDARIENINTSQADWLARLDSLPPMCTVVGGPLQEKNYLAARNAGQMGKRVFFSFLPILGKGEEGAIAWRFFPGQRDQLDALINFASDELKLHAWGAFYPNDKYGPKMTSLLEQELARRNMTLVKVPYNPAAPATWAAGLKTLTGAAGGIGSTPAPQTPFEILFVPDSWKNMDRITTALQQSGEDRLVLAGPALWEPALAGKSVPNAQKYALAVFPAAWSHTRLPAPLKGAGNDFWTCLGYDFIKFAGFMGLAEKPESAAVTSALARRASQSITALAPITWDENGVAHQKMYLFQVNGSGMTPMNAGNFKRTRVAIADRAALRMQGWGHIDPDTGEALPVQRPESPMIQPQPASASEVAPALPPIEEAVAAPSAPAPAAPAPAQAAPEPHRMQPVPGVMRSGPRSSYKLSLPN